MKIPDSIKTNKDKLEFYYSAQELLRLEHNEMGRKFREGEITQGGWDDYRHGFDKKNYELSCEIAPIRDDVMKNELGTQNLNPENTTERDRITSLIGAKKEEFKKSIRFNIDLKNLWQ